MSKILPDRETHSHFSNLLHFKLLKSNHLTSPHTHTTSNDITESFTAPEPTGWGLPLTPTLPGSSSSSSSSTEEITFSYQQFPALSPALFGPIRPARILLQKPEKGRQLSQSSNALQETMEMKARTLGRTDSSRSMGEGSRRAAAMRDRMAAARERNTRLLQSICKVQSLFRMLRPRRRYLVKLKVRSQCPTLSRFVCRTSLSFPLESDDFNDLFFIRPDFVLSIRAARRYELYSDRIDCTP